MDCTTFLIFPVLQRNDLQAGNSGLVGFQNALVGAVAFVGVGAGKDGRCHALLQQQLHGVDQNQIHQGDIEDGRGGGDFLLQAFQLHGGIAHNTAVVQHIVTDLDENKYG